MINFCLRLRDWLKAVNVPLRVTCQHEQLYQLRHWPFRKHCLVWTTVVFLTSGRKNVTQTIIDIILIKHLCWVTTVLHYALDDIMYVHIGKTTFPPMTVLQARFRKVFKGKKTILLCSGPNRKVIYLLLAYSPEIRYPFQNYNVCSMS